MSDKTGIEWTRSDDGTAGATWNPVTGCTKVSAGCDHCYAETFAERWRGIPGHHFEQGFDVTLRPERLDQPLRWKRPRRIFVNSMADLFHEAVPDEYIARVFAVMAMASQHTFLVLTKRHARMRAFLQDDCRCGKGHVPGIHLRSAMDWAGTPHSPTYVPGVVGHDVYHQRQWPLPNVWLGVSAEDQKWADIRIPALLQTPAAIRFVSAEPLLGPVDLTPWLGGQRGDAQEPRGRRVPGRPRRRVENRPGGEGLEGGGPAVEPLEEGGRRHSLRPETRGESGRELLAGQSDVRGGPLSRPGSSPGVEAFRRPDPGRPDGESQERPIHGQPTAEPGVGDLRRAGSACAPGAPEGTPGPVRDPQLHGEADRRGGRGDLLTPGRRRTPNGDCGGLRRDDASDLQDRAGRPSISWLIIGGESGPGARRMAEGWARYLAGQCQDSGVPVFVKQLGSVLGRELGAGPKGGDWDRWPEDLKVRQFPASHVAVSS